MDIGKVTFGPINPNKGPMESASSCAPFNAQAEISELKERVRRLEDQDEVHWRTRRTLLARIDALRSALEQIATGRFPGNEKHEKAIMRQIAATALKAEIVPYE